MAERTGAGAEAGRRGSPVAGLLVLVGLALLAAAGLRTRSLLQERRPAEAVLACVDQPCRANADASPVRGYEAASVAVDPKDPRHLLVADNDLIGARCTWHVTFDGGRKWEDGAFRLPPGYKNCQLDSGGFLPSGNVAFGPSGTVYAVLSSVAAWDGGRRTTGESVLLARSADGGRTFPSIVVAVPGNPPGTSYLRPQLTVAPGQGGRDRLLLTAWGCEPQICRQVVFAQSTDGGDSFAPPVDMSAPVGGNSPSGALPGPEGSIVMTFLRRHSAEQVEVLVARSADGSSFASMVIDTRPGVGLQYDSAKIAADPARGALYTVQSDLRDGQAQVWFRRSTDGGATWSEPVKVNRNTRGPSYSPVLGVAPGGRIDVVFYRRGDKDHDDVHLASSTDGGATFGPDRQITDESVRRTIGYNEQVGDFYPPAVASLDDSVWVAWSDSKYGSLLTNSQEILLKSVAVAPRARA